VTSEATMAPMPTAARYAPTAATYNAPREGHSNSQYPAMPKM